MISASLVKDLRDKTGAGMMDCKKALTETKGNFEAAIDFLRTKGLASAAKRSSKVAAEGLACALVDGLVGAIIEVNSETDFVARNDMFQDLVSDISKLALKHHDLESLKNAIMPSGKSVADEIIELIAKIGENINLRKSNSVKVNDGVVGVYIHGTVAPSLGKIAVLVGLESSADKTKLAQLAHKIAMHIAAARPIVLKSEDLDAAFLARERAIFAEQTKASGKDDNIVEKMIEGRIRKLFEEIVLLNQVFVIDGKQKISEVIASAEKELMTSITIASFVRYEVGEGIVQEEKMSFADEVASTAKH